MKTIFIPNRLGWLLLLLLLVMALLIGMRGAFASTTPIQPSIDFLVSVLVLLFGYFLKEINLWLVEHGWPFVEDGLGTLLTQFVASVAAALLLKFSMQFPGADLLLVLLAQALAYFFPVVGMNFLVKRVADARYVQFRLEAANAKYAAKQAQRKQMRR